MNLHIGDYWGKRYEYLFRYVPFVVRTGIRMKPISEVIIDRPYEKNKYFLPAKGELVIDAGCQYGDYALICAVVYGADVIAYEPLRKNYRVAIKNIEMNKAFRSISLRNKALGSQDGELLMNFKGNMLAVKKRGEEEQNIVFTTLDNELKGSDRQPSLIKIDVEGFETQVLDGGQKTISRYHPKIIVEVHGTDQNKSVGMFLRENGYKMIDCSGNKALKGGVFNYVQEQFWAYT